MDRFRVLVACWVGLLVSGALAGCLSTDAPEADQGRLAQVGPQGRPTVVAIVDTGANPYHAAFRAAPGGASVDSILPLVPDALRVDLHDEGDYDARRETDADFWASAQTGRLYAFAGTRLMVISIAHDDEEPILDSQNHGAATTALVAREDPDAIIVLVQIDASLCDLLAPTEDCPVFPALAEGLRWVADQPWIDVVSLSLGGPGNLPSTPATAPEAPTYVEALKLMQARGKVVVVGAGNQPTPSATTHFSGLPSLIAVGGFEPAQGGESAEASRAVDVVANFTEYVAAQRDTDAYAWGSGTSFSAPIVAGTLSRALREVRADMGHLDGITVEGALAVQGDRRVTSKDFRDALNATAVRFAATGWDPTAPASNDTRVNLLTQSTPVLLPAGQMGWGYVHGGLADEIARRVLESDSRLPAEKATTAQFQVQWQAAREAYWSRQA